MALCNVTGTVYLPSGEIAANRRIVFRREVRNITAEYLGAMFPDDVTTTTSATGEIDVNLVTGRYIAFATGSNISFFGVAVVPDAATANFEDILNLDDIPDTPPAWYQQALDARNAAIAAAEDAGGSAAAAGEALAQIGQATATVNEQVEIVTQAAADVAVALPQVEQARSDAQTAATQAQDAAASVAGRAYSIDALDGLLDTADIKIGSPVDLTSFVPTGSITLTGWVSPAFFADEPMVITTFEVVASGAGTITVASYTHADGVFTAHSTQDVTVAPGYNRIENLDVPVQVGGAVGYRAHTSGLIGNGSPLTFPAYHSETNVNPWTDTTIVNSNHAAKLTVREKSGASDIKALRDNLFEVSSSVVGSPSDLTGLTASLGMGGNTNVAYALNSDMPGVCTSVELVAFATGSLTIRSWKWANDVFTLYAEQTVAIPVTGHQVVPVNVPVVPGGAVGFFSSPIVGKVGGTAPFYAGGTATSPSFIDNNGTTLQDYAIKFHISRKQIIDLAAAQPSIPQPDITDGAGLHAWRAALGRLEIGGGAKVVITGDSWTQRLDCAAAPLAGKLYAAHGQGGDGWLSVDAARTPDVQLLNGAQLSTTGTWARQDMSSLALGVDGHSLQTSEATATMTVSGFRGTRLRWYYLDNAGRFQYAIDGGAPVSVVGTNSGQVRKIDVTGLSTGLHDLVITHTGTTAALRHYGGYATTETGIELSKSGNGSSYGSQWIVNGPLVTGIAADITPDVLIVILGTNDSRLGHSADNYEAGLRAIIAGWRAARSDTGVILCLPPENGDAIGSPLFAEYLSRLRAIRSDTPGVEIVSLYDLWPSYSVSQSQGLWADSIHPNLAGGHVIASTLMRMLTP